MVFNYVSEFSIFFLNSVKRHSTILISKKVLIMKISKRQIERYPVYLKYLLSLKGGRNKNVSSPMIAKALGYSEEQVRKDLQIVSKQTGKPNRGRNIDELIKDIQSFLGYDHFEGAVIVGVGHLGKAFMNYSGFMSFGLNIVAGFDVDPNLIGTKIRGRQIYDLYSLGKIVNRLNIKIAILAVPQDNAQMVVNQLVNCGIEAIWNFVPTHIDVPENVVVENVNLASSLAVLSHKLHTKENRR